ncbi:MAG: response regulator transcription factor [Rhodopirellula sp.]|nr:response regulator transcription factor [Rhodopirellula sp.]
MRLLLVEDYPPLQKSVVKGLREAGFAVDVTGDGQEALWYAEGNQYDVIVLDLMLPGLDGLSILRRLRAEGRESHVLIITAKDAVSDRVAGLNAGADDYLIKPFEFEELLARIQALVRRSYHRKNPVLAIGPLRIDTSIQHVQRNGEAEVDDVAARTGQPELHQRLLRREETRPHRLVRHAAFASFHGTLPHRPLLGGSLH